ncbi:hypothetical protein V8F06_005741 [Rhypophila decipiens]
MENVAKVKCHGINGRTLELRREPLRNDKDAIRWSNQGPRLGLLCKREAQSTWHCIALASLLTNLWVEWVLVARGLAIKCSETRRKGTESAKRQNESSEMARGSLELIGAGSSPRDGMPSAAHSGLGPCFIQNFSDIQNPSLLECCFKGLVSLCESPRVRMLIRHSLVFPVFPAWEKQQELRGSLDSCAENVDIDNLTDAVGLAHHQLVERVDSRVEQKATEMGKILHSDIEVVWCVASSRF